MQYSPPRRLHPPYEPLAALPRLPVKPLRDLTPPAPYRRRPVEVDFPITPRHHLPTLIILDLDPDIARVGRHFGRVFGDEFGEVGFAEAAHGRFADGWGKALVFEADEGGHVLGGGAGEGEGAFGGGG